MDTALMPTLFLSHGSPMHALRQTQASKGWQDLAAQLPQPRAILMASAHWETSTPFVSTTQAPEIIHDFTGFPDALYQMQYPAPGAPNVAQQALSLIIQAGLVAHSDEGRGLDHGAWVPLRYLYPNADIPVAQISIQPQLDAAHHMALGRALAPLRAEDVLIIGSGHLTHNLREYFMRAPLNANVPVPTEPYVTEFSQWIENTLQHGDELALTQWKKRAPHALRAHPSDEHFLPLPLAYGASWPSDSKPPQAMRIELGVDMGVLAMDAYVFSPADH